MRSNEMPEWAKDATASILQTLLKKDPFTFLHCCRVGQMSRALGQVMGLNEGELTLLEFSGLFHDIGKVGLPDHVLLKPARLDESEFKLMKNHAEMSVEILRPLANHAFFRFIIPGVRFHHERFDGKGYPVGLKGEQIPLAARIISVVDAVDAMMNTRPYRQAQTWEYVQKELIDYSGTQFDPKITQIYLAAASKGLFEPGQIHNDVIVTSLKRFAA